MSVYRSYFSKNNTLIDRNESNNSQNPVTEISYGTLLPQPSRFIFDVDLSGLVDKINSGYINPDNIVKHVLHMTNTISYAPEYKGKTSYSMDIERASSFELDLYNIDEDWDEGSGYDFVYDDTKYPLPPHQASNWYYRKTEVPWRLSGGSYVSGETVIIGNQHFDGGDENLEIDVTDYINERIGLVSGDTGYTGTSYGLGLKFVDELEYLETLYRQAVGFHTKYTHTFYEPYIETIFDDTIKDDRNYFYLDKDNNLYLYVNTNLDVEVLSVDIYDYENNLISTLSGGTGNSIQYVKKGVFKINLNIESQDYPDSVIFRDVWNLIINGKEKTIEKQFYIISDENHIMFNVNHIDFDNYFFYFYGINQNENVRRGDIRRIGIDVKELYPNQDNFIPLDLDYRLYITVAEGYQVDVIPYTPVNRTSSGYYVDIDTSWLIPQQYKLQIRLKNGVYYKSKEELMFNIVSDGIKI